MLGLKNEERMKTRERGGSGQRFPQHQYQCLGPGGKEGCGESRRGEGQGEEGRVKRGGSKEGWGEVQGKVTIQICFSVPASTS